MAGRRLKQGEVCLKVTYRARSRCPLLEAHYPILGAIPHYASACPWRLLKDQNRAHNRPAKVCAAWVMQLKELVPLLLNMTFPTKWRFQSNTFTSRSYFFRMRSALASILFLSAALSLP